MEPKKRKKVIFWAIAIVVLLAAWKVGWVIFHKPAYHGRVIDADTKRPIEGAVVVAVYTAWYPRFLVEGAEEPIGVKETLTNKNGEFRIFHFRSCQPWGPC
jgi:hypothetical protein